MMSFKRVILILFTGVVGLSSCKKNDDAPPLVYTTTIDVINASSDTLNFYLNGTRINNRSSLVPTGSSGYTDVPFGLQNYQFKKAGSTTVLFSAPFAADTSKRYSIFIGGESADKAFITLDSIHRDTGDIAMIRFVNSSPLAGTVDIYANNKIVSANRAFKSVTDFVSVKSGALSIKIYQSGSTGTPQIDGVITLQTGQVYTLYTRSPVGASTAVFGVSLMTNN